MTIGKRKGYTTKGAGSPGTEIGKSKGGSLSKNDHWYIQQAFGMGFDPGAGSLEGLTATGGIISEYNDPTGQAYTAHTFTAPGSFVVSLSLIHI